ncbi:MAG: hypothetical protein OEZ01_11525 [Candidatus Heimdallarchaeota archaeon]|nr:hypothetical protein [Candidatus Heimdallarchaeota archaeon]
MSKKEKENQDSFKGSNLFITMKNSKTSGNISIKSFHVEREVNELEKKHDKLEKQILGLEEKRQEVKLLRDDQNLNTKIQFDRSKESKEERDRLGEKLNDLRKQKDELKDRKNKLLEQRTQLYAEMNEITDKKLRDEKYEELKLIKDELPKLFNQLNELHDELVLTSDKKQSLHEDFKAYQLMGRQSSNLGDKYHGEFVELGKQIRALRNQARNSRNDLRDKKKNS